MALHYPARMRQAKRWLLLACLAAPFAGPAAAVTPLRPEIASLQLHAAAFDLYQQRNFSSLIRLLEYRNAPNAVFAPGDKKAFLADFLYQPKDLASISPTLIAGRLPDALLSRDETDVVLADLYLGVGLPAAAEKLLRDLDGRPTAAPRHSWLNLARYYYRRGHLTEARRALARLDDLPQEGPLQAERNALSALVNLAANKDDEAVAALKKQAHGQSLSLDRYNLGLTLLNMGRLDEGAAALTSAAGDDPLLRRLAAAELGYTLLAHAQWDRAAAVLQGAAGDGPYSDYGQLGAGWAAALKGDMRKALASWQPLAKTSTQSMATQEALLAVPYAYYQLQDYDQAETQYRRAIDHYQTALKRLRDARPPLADGHYVDDLLAANPGAGEFDSHWQAQRLPAFPALPYLLSTLADASFQAGLRNYRDLHIARDNLAAAGHDLDASLSLLTRQREVYVRWQQQLQQGDRDRSPAALAARIKELRRDLERAEAHRDVMQLATVDQTKLLFRLKESKRLLDIVKNYIVDYDELYARYRLLRGLMLWDLTEQYPARLQEVRQQLKDLELALSQATHDQELLTRNGDQVIGEMNTRERAFKALRARQTTLAAAIPPLLQAQKASLIARLNHGLDQTEAQLNAYLVQARLGLAQAADRQAAAAPDPDYGRAITAYQAFLDHSGEDAYRRDAMLRLAHLKMLQADNRQAAGTGNDLYGEAITLLLQALKEYPRAPDNDRVLYNLAKAYDHRGETDALLDTLDRFPRDYPRSAYADEVQFRRGELLFSLGLPGQAAAAYGRLAAKGAESLFYDKARYKLAWSKFKDGSYDGAVDGFLTLLQDKLAGGAQLSRGDEELVNDLLRGAVLSLAQLKGVDTLAAYYKRHGAQPYEHRLYQTLAQLYLEQQRIEDAANVYRRFVALHPNDSRAPLFDSQVLAVYQQGGFADLLQRAKEDFINRYQPAADYWRSNPPGERGEVLGKVREYLQELTRYAHARAQQSKAAADYRQAEQWYALFLSSFPEDPAAADMHYLYGDILFEDGRYAEAAVQYQAVAYDLKDPKQGAEAGYAAALALDKVAAAQSGIKRDAAEQHYLLALQRFAEAYPGDARAPAALMKAAQEWFTRKDRPRATAAAQRLLDMQPAADKDLRRNAWTLLGLSAFEDRRYADAEQDYTQVLALMAKDDPKRPAMEDHLAASIYKQGEQARAANELRTAVKHFLRLADATPGVDSVATAQYDAAAALLALEDWRRAIEILEMFRKAYPKNPLQKELAPKLAVAYQQVEDWPKAAAELETLATQGDSEELRRDAVWQSAQLYLRAQRIPDAQRMLKEYVHRFPKPVAEAVEAEQLLADLYQQQHDAKQRRHWLEQIIATDATAGAERSDRTRLLAGRAALELADAKYQRYAAITLTRPLKKSLRRKKQAMETALGAYRDMSQYGIAEITTAATFRAARIYSELGKAIMDSERPKGLSALELEQYNVLLEEQAYPFEEKAIALHEANARRTADNLYDDSIKQSFAALRKLLPGRYAKAEKGEDYVDAIY